MKIPLFHSLVSHFKPRTFRKIHGLILLLGIFLSSACSSDSIDGEAWIYPFPLKESNECYKVATPFSVENPWDHAHEAVDFACLPGTPVLAVHAGVIEKIIYSELVGGERVKISLVLSDFSVIVEYLNLRQVEVHEGQMVDEGMRLGLSALGLHVAVWDQEQGVYVDPSAYLILPVPEEILE